MFERKTKAEHTKGQTLHQAHDWHMKKAVVCTRLSDKRFSERNFEVFFSVEKGNQIHSLHSIHHFKNRKLKNQHTDAGFLSACLFHKWSIPLYPY